VINFWFCPKCFGFHAERPFVPGQELTDCDKSGLDFLYELYGGMMEPAIRFKGMIFTADEILSPSVSDVPDGELPF